MRTPIAFLFVLLGGCATTNWVAADKSTIAKLGGQELACGKAEVVYYGIRGADVPASSPCFGESAQALAVAQCGDKRKAYWKTGGKWAARTGEVTAVDETGIEITLASSENAAGSMSAVARCAR